MTNTYVLSFYTSKLIKLYQNKYLWLINNIIPSIHHFLQARKEKYSIHVEIDAAFTVFNCLIRITGNSSKKLNA